MIQEQKLKSYWNRPGGKFGTILGILGFGLIGYYVLPIFTGIIWNTLNFGIALLCLGLFLYAVTHKKLRMGLFYFYEILMKKLLGIVIELDPFIIAEDYIKDMIKERSNLLNKSNEVNGEKERVRMKIQENEREITRNMDMAKTASKSGDGSMVALTTRQAERYTDYNNRLIPLEKNLTIISEYLMKLYKESGHVIQDRKNELNIKKDLYNSVTKANNALSSAMKIFNGDPEKQLLVEQSMNSLAQNIGNKLGEMKNSIRITGEFMNSIDLNNATFEQKGLRALEEYNKGERAPLTFDKKEKIKRKAGEYKPNKYDKLLK